MSDAGAGNTDSRSLRFLSPGSVKRRRLADALIVVTSLVALIACGDPYLHTNPYDPAYPVAFTIAGPDTLFSLGEIGQYSVQTIPAWPDTGIVWAIGEFTDPFIIPPRPPLCGNQVVRGDTVLKGNGLGAYQSILPPLEPYAFTIAVEAWAGTIDTTFKNTLCGGFEALAQGNVARHVGYKNVVVTQRVTHIQLRCPDTHACAPLAAGDSAFIWVDGFDALGKPIAALTSPTANPATGNPTTPFVTSDTAILRALVTNNPVVFYASRDSTIARTASMGIRVARVTAGASGSTWVVATRGALLDSLQIVVH